MNYTLKASLIFISSALVMVACNNGKKNSQAPATSQNTPAVIQKADTQPKQQIMPKPQFMKDGLNTIRYDNGKIKMEGKTEDGKKTGEWKSYFEDGTLQSDEFFTEDQKDGKVIVYFPNGKKMYEGEAKMGALVGKWKYWDDKGNLTRTVDYSKQPATHQ
jgi:antitoxin component YwqK of YwqJK toxin-antitoxin module